jgi:ABC-2 type transport system ATP-binding protein
VDDAPAGSLLDARDLRARYGERWALAGLSFEVRAGEVVGLLGPNGAGKTTTLSVLATLRRPDGGTAAVGGHDVERAPAAVRRILGLVPQNLAVYPTLTARENVLFFARLFGLRGAQLRQASESALALVGLEERAGDVVATFSGGMQRRLNLACGLLHRPRVLLLDEPTVGVDPQSRERIFDAVREQSRAGAAVLYSTHAMEEAERFCDRVVLIDGGRVVASGTPSALIDESGGDTRLEVATRASLPQGWLDGVAGARPLAASQPEEGAFLAHVALDELTSAARVLERAAERGGGVVDFHLFQPSLQDVFLRLTGHDLRD